MQSSRSTPSSPPAESRIVPNARPSRYPTFVGWLKAGFRRHHPAILGALIAAWTGLPFALWAAAVGLVLGAVAGGLGSSFVADKLGTLGDLFNLFGGGILGALVGAVVGLLSGLLLIYFVLITHPLQFLSLLIAGVLISLLVFLAMDLGTTLLMPLRGYRHPSRRERQKLSPLFVDAGARMGLDVLPDYWISDSKKPGAWAHMRAIVVTRGLLGDYDATDSAPQPDLDDPALTAILAHELNHWEHADVVGLTMVTACFAPFVLIVNFVQWLRIRSEWMGLILWFFFWPIWLCSRFVIVPLMGQASRRYEFEADARAATLGEPYRLGLRRALTELSAWEAPRSGWEEVLAATHPPIEARLEALEQPIPVAIAPAEPVPTRPRRPEPQRTPPPAKPQAPAKPASRRKRAAPPSPPATVSKEPPPVAQDFEPYSTPDDGEEDGRW